MVSAAAGRSFHRLAGNIYSSLQARHRHLPLLLWRGRSHIFCAPSVSTMSTEPDTKQRKAEMRKSLKATLKASSADDMASQSQAIARRILDAPFFLESSSVAVYLTAPRLREVDTGTIVTSILQPGGCKRCYVPVVVDSSSNMRFLHIESMGSLVGMPPFGILEPTPAYPNGSPREDVLQRSLPLDLILLPGLGFDMQGGRLGRGGGYYDKFLDQIQQLAQQQGWKKPLLAALAFQQQVVDSVPMEEFDRRIDYLVTSGGIFDCRNAGG